MFVIWSSNFQVNQKKDDIEFEFNLFLRMIMNKIQQLSMSQIENLQVPLNDDEEQLIATIPSHVRISFVIERIKLKTFDRSVDNTEFVRWTIRYMFK